jgi:hypothetical protein
LEEALVGRGGEGGAGVGAVGGGGSGGCGEGAGGHFRVVFGRESVVRKFAEGWKFVEVGKVEMVRSDVL